MALNVVTMMGRLVADPQLKQTNSGKGVTSLRVAVDRGRKDASGQNQADFFDVVCWEKTAEFVGKYFQKGSMIAFTGQLQSRKYQDKNGNGRQAVEIVARDVSFCGEKNDAPTHETSAQSLAAASTAIPAYSHGRDDDFSLIQDNDDLPF